MIVRSRAPLRISFGGGGTDVSPYLEERGGAVLSATIDKYACCNLSRGSDGFVKIRSLDYDVTVTYESASGPPNGTELGLLTAVLRRFRLNHGIEMLVQSDSPPGSGLGASSAMAVAAVGAAWKVLDMGAEIDAIAETAFLVERMDAGIAGGRQDQYAAAYGGLNFIEFRKDRTTVQPLHVPADLLDTFQSCLLLCDTGKRRPSANIINEQVQRYKSRQKDIVQALDCTKELAYRMKAALLRGDLDEFGRFLNEAWTYKRRFSNKVSDPMIDQMYDRALEYGAFGGKLLGAGAGGFMLFLCETWNREQVAKQLTKLGGTIVPFRVEKQGLSVDLIGGRGGS